MSLSRTALQTLGAIALLAVALACNGGKSSSSTSSDTTAALTGTITYQRVPLATDANGVPTGLKDASVATNLTSLPARGVMVRAYQQVSQTLPNGSTTTIWTLAGTALTDANGAYSITLTKGRATMTELLSTFNGGGGFYMNVLAEPAGFNSTTLNMNQLRYGMRKAADGTASSSTNVPASVINGDTTLNFSVGLNDVWWLVNPEVNTSTSEATSIATAVLETSVSGHTTGTGSRVLGIGDSLCTFLTNYGATLPGANLDLHYWRGNEALGSFVEYQRDLVAQHNPLYDPSNRTYHYRGNLKAGPVNDDAWDEGVIFPLLARNVLWSSNFGRTYAVPLNPLFPTGVAQENLSVDMARIEGLAEAMAANLLKSPYLADTTGTTVASVKDIRSNPGSGPNSATALRAFAWQLVLKANNIVAPGLAADWANMNPLAATRFFLAPSGLTNGATDTTARDIEPLNVYSQLTRLREAKSTAEPVDLNTVFSDAVLTTLGAPYGITWPRPTTGALASFVADWGADPNATTTPLAPVAMSMANATAIGGVYPNVSSGEIFYAGFSMNADKRYTLRATITPALASGSSLDVDLPMMNRTFTFTGTGTTTDAIVIPVYTTAPVYHPVRLRLKNASAAQTPVSVSIAFIPAL